MNEYVELTEEELLLVYGGTSAGGSGADTVCNVLCTAAGVFTGNTVQDCTGGCGNWSDPSHGGGDGAEGRSGQDGAGAYYDASAYSDGGYDGGASYDPGYSGGS